MTQSSNLSTAASSNVFRVDCIIGCHSANVIENANVIVLNRVIWNWNLWLGNGCTNEWFQGKKLQCRSCTSHAEFEIPSDRFTLFRTSHYLSLKLNFILVQFLPQLNCLRAFNSFILSNMNFNILNSEYHYAFQYVYNSAYIKPQTNTFIWSIFTQFIERFSFEQNHSIFSLYSTNESTFPKSRCYSNSHKYAVTPLTPSGWGLQGNVLFQLWLWRLRLCCQHSAGKRSRLHTGESWLRNAPATFLMNISYILFICWSFYKLVSHMKLCT